MRTRLSWPLVAASLLLALAGSGCRPQAPAAADAAAASPPELAVAGAVLGCIPVVLIYFLFVDRYVQGMSGALKG